MAPLSTDASVSRLGHGLGGQCAASPLCPGLTDRHGVLDEPWDPTPRPSWCLEKAGLWSSSSRAPPVPGPLNPGQGLRETQLPVEDRHPVLQDQGLGRLGSWCGTACAQGRATGWMATFPM